MDTFIDRYGSIIFNDTEIDLICSAIEDFFFKEFLSEKHTELFVRCMMDDSDGAVDCVIHCNNRSTETMRNKTLSLGEYFCSQFYEKMFNVRKTAFEMNSASFVNGKELATVVCLKILGLGYVFVIGGYDDDSLRDSASTSAYGLALFICKMLGKRNRYGKELVKKIEGAPISTIGDSTRDAICRNVNSYMQNNSII